MFLASTGNGANKVLANARLLYIYCSGANFDETPRHNTPMKLREKYTKLYDIEWNDAYDYFREKGWNEIETVVTLQRILRVSKTSKQQQHISLS